MKINLLPVFAISLLSLSIAGSGQTTSWYKSFAGSISKSPVTLHLHKMGQTYAGYYYYNSVQQPIYLLGNDTATGDGKIRLNGFAPENDNDYTSEVLTLSITGNKCSGQWQKDETAPGLPFSATEKYPSPFLFDMIYTTGTLKLKPEMAGSPEASFEAASVWPKEKTTASVFTRLLINAAFGANNTRQEIGKTLLDNKKVFIDNYLEENKNAPDSEIIQNIHSYNNSETRRMMVMYHSPKLLTLGSRYYSYAGGAHGNYGTTYTTIDLSSIKKLVVGDILTPDGITNLNGLLEKYFRKQYKLEANESLSEGGLFEDTIGATDNFYITGKGIGFSYAPYEIGPYALGEINLFVPFTELSAYLQPDFKKLISP
jgi:hypothetical protein